MPTLSAIWKVLKNTPEQIWYAVAAALFLALGSLFWRRAVLRHWRRFKGRLARKRAKTLTDRHSGIIILEYGPGISIDDRSITEIRDRFKLGMPADLVKDLLSRPGFSGKVDENTVIFGSDSLERLGEILKIGNISEKISPHYDQTVKDFRTEAKGIRFNGQLYGVRKFRRGRMGTNETPCLSLSVYETDYFTFRVMDAFHREIAQKERQHSLLSLAADEDINDHLYPFLVSIGLNFLVLCSDQYLILTRRSRNVDTFGLPPESIYPSFNEAVSGTDLINPAGPPEVPSIPNCFKRGLEEELGLRADEVEPPSYRMVGFGLHGVGLGVFGYAETNLPSAEIVARVSGRDRAFESAAVFAVPISKKSFRNLIRAPETSPQVGLLLRALGNDRGWGELF